jgi:hypothetical protein
MKLPINIARAATTRAYWLMLRIFGPFEAVALGRVAAMIFLLYCSGYEKVKVYR